MIALSPADLLEAYELTYRAFNYAERYRTPVFLMGNKETGVTKESVDLESCELPPRVERTPVPEGQLHYSPHAFERPEEVPPLAPFGGDHVARYNTSTHDKAAYLTTRPGLIQEMLEHYAAKIHAAVDDIALWREDRQEGAEILVLSYGITSRAAAVAVREARRKGRKVSALVLQTLWPVPEKAIRAAMAYVSQVVVPEMNLGQYVREIERLALPSVEVVSVAKMDTTLLSPGEILEKGGLL